MPASAEAVSFSFGSNSFFIVASFEREALVLTFNAATTRPARLLTGTDALTRSSSIS